ncbi:MAG: ABC transporter substrate-binding protein [Streptosporangiales bacterium]|jgi:NitT/TauT family transport system substrate-binding protein|nr:ABC transporter substrate-binding protein [Streptosporangiales bacterium]
MRFWKAGSSAFVVAAVSLLAAACTPALGASDAPEKPNIVVTDFPTVDAAGLYIAQMDGLFRQQGLNVTIRPAAASQLAASSVVNGTSDIAVADYVTYINTEINQGARLRIIDEASALQPDDLALLASPRSGIGTLSQLQGRTVGVVAEDDISTLLVDAVLTENGVNPQAVNLEPGFPLQNVAGQVNSGLAEAAPIPEPFASESEQTYGLREVADIDQGVTKNFPLDGYAVTEAWARKHPNTLAAFSRALQQGQQIADTDRSQVEAAVEKYLVISPWTASMVALPDYPLSVNPGQLQRVVDAMVQFSLLPPENRNFKITSMTG